MGPQAESDEEFIVLSTPDCTESASYPSAQAGGLKSNANLFVKSIGLLSSLLEARVTEFQASGTARTHIPKYSEKMGRQIADHRSVTNYTYIINGGRGGSGGEGGDQGGDGGAGQGPTVYFGHPRDQESSDFRTIRRGDLKMIREVRLSTDSCAVSRQSRGVCVRRTVYHAEIRGDPGIVTVATYQGDGAEKEWRKDVAKYKSVWHPHIMQLYGLVSSTGLYAMVFHDGSFQHSPILTTYIMAYCDTESEKAIRYICDVLQKPSMYDSEIPVWIRPPTGELCLDLVQATLKPTVARVWWRNAQVFRLENVTLDAPDSEAMVISSLSEDLYHQLCSEDPIAKSLYFQVSTEHPVGPGIFRSDSQHGTCVRITEPLQILPDKELDWNNYGNAPDELLPNSWIRYDSHRTNPLLLELQLPFWKHRIVKAWLAQANCIFAELEETAHIEDYVCIYTVEFTLRIADERDIPEGYLFLCPSQDFCTSTEPHANLYQWPACPAYWSLDPSGADHLSTEDARNLGFPAIHIETRMYGYSWDHSVYEGLRRFHEGKGHDPESRDVARELGYPLFEVLSDPVPFPAHKGER
ncbi:hypothetical protein MSAN_01516300 [Mycena sanguinolenta]|uniref:Uncharacterized protein n=1 Tax=Mycena sanguinolenta TaxID=230812 RepID=A0A8H6Y7I9_9AGAR|nr:hypothetical protein MSAN_01516300 [Mycena sanguinolenta]